MRTSVLLLLICSSVLLLPDSATANLRFPQPEFSTEYSLPKTNEPPPRSTLYDYLDVAVLFASLSLAGFLVLKKRSRKLLLLLSLFCLVYFGFWRRGCVCAVGSLQNMTLALGDRTYAVPLVVLAFFMLPLVFTLLFGRTFCGAVCPLGGIQDLVVLRPLKLPEWLNQALGIIPYIYLAAAVLLATTGSGFLVCRYDPFVSFFRLAGKPHMFALGAAFLVLGTFVGRPYCRFFCPYGVLLRWTSRFSLRHVTITPDECVKCRLCENACPFDAIRDPTPVRALGPRSIATRRLAVALLMIPVLTVAGVWGGSFIAPVFAGADRTVVLAREVKNVASGLAEHTTETEAFMSTGETIQALNAEAAAIGGRINIGSRFFGAFLGLVIASRIAALCMLGRRADYEPDRASCYSCARCFATCPREHVRLKGLAGPATDQPDRNE